MNEFEEVTPLELVPKSVIQVVFDAISRGASVTAACREAGVGRTSFYAWVGASEEIASLYANAVKQQVHARFSKS
ncbi:hypothetical protein [Paraburkholderia caffeinilytica]|uniref:terminase small subunit-like protein n=1 Tax=Paraburkholderia caffeinilytica TaxID=1761016 RepID=UPI003DA0A3E1